ncbi:unnamed protein product [Adineta steineri]|uniref:Uncharacterized protein n=1 Tax=Adineta steineri TaxID=433720 RepID=A0A815JAS7_9BILA|nr:unnamed protein product [Adineta steineri]
MSDKEDNISDYCAQSWKLIRDLFHQNFIENLDIGASLCIFYRGECVVDLVGGWLTNWLVLKKDQTQRYKAVVAILYDFSNPLTLYKTAISS